MASRGPGFHGVCTCCEKLDQIRENHSEMVNCATCGILYFRQMDSLESFCTKCKIERTPT